MRTFIVLMVTVLGMAGSAAGADVQKGDVDIKAADGVNLRGTYFSPGRPGPAILLLHQCNMDRHAWDAFANDLAAAGFHVLTFDWRGYGDSGGERFTDMAQRQPVMAQKWPGDVDTAFDYLLSRAGVDRARVAAGGASCGVAQSANFARRRPAVKALVELSGSAPDAISYVGATPSLAVFGAASEGDKSAAEGVRAIVGASKNPTSKLQVYEGTEHGVPMFAKHTDLEPAIISWLRAQLGTASERR
jgi:dienelactone hydrolase